ncbi:MAG TPA: hypothetical protein PKY82_16075 [Pyrinomonadaceae bacterium]|nr:hypothetical protein [Pyrinomonadaceae bacterium]
MKKKGIPNKKLSRQRLANPNYGIKHDELLKKANIQNHGNYELVTLPNGRIAYQLIDKKEKK